MNTRTMVWTVMTALLSIDAVTAAVPEDILQPARDSSPPHRSLSAIHLDVHAALRAEAVTRRQGKNAPQVILLIDLYREMAAHPQRDKSVFLTRLGLRVQTRLEIVRDQLERQYTKSIRDEKKKDIPSNLVVPEAKVLTQQVAVQAGGAFGQAAQPGADAAIDYGPELVDLIQQTISPATWNINGGNGAVVYFTPRRALVISAPQAIHERIDEVLGQLRAVP